MISFKNIPGQTRLFQDFMHDFDRVSGFYRGQYKNPKDVQRRLEELKSFPHRDVLVDALNRQHPNASGATRANIVALGQSTTVAVVTGQQMGFFFWAAFYPV